jgi:hypothetical protein
VTKHELDVPAIADCFGGTEFGVTMGSGVADVRGCKASTSVLSSLTPGQSRGCHERRHESWA